MTPHSDGSSNLEHLSSDLLSAEEIGVLLGCTSRTVNRYARSGKLPPGIAVGKFRRWPRMAVLKMFALL